MPKGRPWYSSKHNLHVYKFECSLLPNCLAINCSFYFRGGTSVLAILKNKRKLHETFSRKSNKQASYKDDDDLQETFGNLCAMLVNNGYREIQDFRTEIHSIKKLQGRIMFT